MGTSTSSQKAMPGSKAVSNQGFKTKSIGNVEAGSTVDNAGGKGYRADIRKGGGSSHGGAKGKGMANTY